jgi:hypothetical protein
MLLRDEFHAAFGEVAAFGGNGPFVVDLDECGRRAGAGREGWGRRRRPRYAVSLPD